MYNSDGPSAHELPSTKKLIKSTVLAAVASVVLLVTVVMPAEYGIDPTGLGNAIGLKRMGEIKVSLAEEAAADQAADAQAALAPTVIPAAPAADSSPSTTSPNPPKTDEITVTLAPDQGTEIKVVMAKGGKVEYTWSTDGGKANFDVHADSKVLGINYHNYSKGSEQTKEGVLVAAFDGSHGWFWRNRTSSSMTITLQTNGQYTEMKHFK